MSAATNLLASLYRKRDADALRALAREALALADVIEPCSDPAPPQDSAPAPARTSAQRTAKWRARRDVTSGVTSGVTCDAGDASGDVTCDVGDASGDVTVTSPRDASRASFLGSDQKISSENTENSEENTARAPASVTPEEVLRRTLKADHDGVLDGWRDGVAAAKGARPTSLQWRDRDVLAECIVTHALDVTDRRAWLTTNAEAFARSRFSDYGGVTPKRFAIWLDSGKPAGTKPDTGRTRGRTSTLQGHGTDDWGQYAAPPIGDETP